MDFTFFHEFDFWQSFTSNFLATFLGAIIGIPIALFISQIRDKIERKQKDIDDLYVLYQSLKVLSESFPINRRHIVSMINTVHVGKSKINFELDISAWNAVDQNVISSLKDPKLHYRISRYYSRLSHIFRVSNNYYILGVLENISFGSNIDKRRLNAEKRVVADDLNSFLPELLDEGDNLERDIQNRMRGIRKKLAKNKITVTEKY